MEFNGQKNIRIVNHIVSRLLTWVSVRCSFGMESKCLLYSSLFSILLLHTVFLSMRQARRIQLSP